MGRSPNSCVFKNFTNNIDDVIKIENYCIVDKIYGQKNSRVLFVIQFVQKIKQGALIERDWLKSQVDYQISESFDWHNKELFLF